VFRIASLLVLGTALLGCSSPNKQLVQIQQDKEQLLVAIRDQRDKNRHLIDQVASLETRLDQAEKELARAGTGTRISTRPTSTLPAERSEPLPWRSPSEKNNNERRATGPGSSKTGSLAPRPPYGALAALAARDSRLQYDPRRGQAQLAAPLEFDEKTGNLTAESRRQLDQVSRFLRSEQARDFQIAVSAVGGPERAQAVADYLDSHGIPQDRLTVESLDPIAPASLRPNSSREVRITLSEADPPLLR
jgi:outer membrane protein OmpA-like peptidoglycan-associated protein